MGEGFAFIDVKQRDIPGRRLRYAQLEPQTNAVDVVGTLSALQRVSRLSEPEPLFDAALWTTATGRS